MSEEAISVFLSYSRSDLEMLTKLNKQLASLVRTQKIKTWHDRDIEAGSEWEPEIQHRLNTADIIILLISADFMASEYCYGNELKRAIERHDAGEARVIPVILKPCLWNLREMPFSKLNVLPDHARPITKWEDPEEAYAAVALHISNLVENLRQRKIKQEPEQQRQAEEQERLRQAEPLRQQPATETEQIENLDDHTKLEMVRIAGKRFLMGSPDNEADREEREGPQHRVEIRSFAMGKYLVTQEQWWVVATKFPKVNQDLEPEPSHFKGDRLPVERVSWYDAIEFCDRLSRKTQKTYRLPSEAEWEYACRAGTTTPFYFGNTITSELVNFGNKYGGTTDVGKFQPNAFGLYDMHGNGWEWCADHWHENYNGAPTNGNAWLTTDQEAARLVRGGSWGGGPSFCRSAYRNYDYPGDRNINIGFRVVCGLA